MEKKLYLKIYGSRGTVPVCEKEFRQYGGNTACTGFVFLDKILIFDAGTGIRNLAAQWQGKCKEYHIFLSHLHMDHIQGLPLFTPLYDREASVTIYGMTKKGRDIREQLYDYLATALWPVGEEAFSCKLAYQKISESNSVYIKGEQPVTVRAVSISHPGGACAYRAETEEGIFVHGLDYEHGNGQEAVLGEFARGADIFLYDGQYFPEEYEKKAGWGHSTWKEGRKLQENYKIKKLLVGHHEPVHTDEELRAEEEKMYQQCPKGICFIKEEMEVYFEKN